MPSNLSITVAPTETDPSNPPIQTNLSAEQVVVLRQVMLGKTIAQAAEAARVSRSTVYRWQTGDPHYIAALNAWHWQTKESLRRGLLTLGEHALAAIQNALLKGDAKIGITLLKSLDLLTPTPQGETDPEAISRTQEFATYQARVRKKEAEEKLELWRADRRWQE